MSPDGLLLDINDSGEKVLNIEKSKFVGRYNFFHDRILKSQKFEEMVQNILQTGTFQEGNIRFRRYEKGRDASLSGDDALFLSGVIHPVLDRSGNVRYLVGQFIDKTEQKSLSPEKYMTIAEYAYDWEEWIRPDGSYEYLSPSFKRITGYEPTELLQDPELLLRICCEEDRSLLRSQIREAFDNKGTLRDFEFRIHHRDGALLWIHHSSQPVYSEQGKYLGQRASNRDITRRKNMELKLRSLTEMNSRLSTDYAKNIKSILEDIPSLIPGRCLIFAPGRDSDQDGIIWYDDAYSCRDGRELISFWKHYHAGYLTLKTDKADVYRDEFQDTSHSCLENAGIGSFIFYNFYMGTLVRGSLCILHEPGFVFSDFDQYLLSTVGQILDTQMQKEDLFDVLTRQQADLEKRSADIELIKSLNEAGNTCQNFGEIIQFLYNYTTKSFNSYGYIFLPVDRDKETIAFNDEILRDLTRKKNRITGRESSPKIYSFVDDPLLKSYFEHPEQRLMVDGSPAMEHFRSIFSEVIGTRSLFDEMKECLIVPVLSDKQILGVLCLPEKERVRKTDEIRLGSVALALVPIFEKFSAAERLRKSELQYRGLVEQSNDGIVILQDEIIHFANPKMGDILLLENNGLVGRNFLDFVNEEEREKFRKRHHNRLNGGYEPAIYDMVLVRTNGERIPVEINSSVSQSLHGRPASLTIVRDTRERKKAEDARTNFLIQQEKLRSMNIMAASIAHNFNNALQSILGGMEIAMQTMGDDSPAYKILKLSESSAREARELGQLMLTYVGYTQGRFDEIELNGVLQSEADKFHSEQQNIEISIRLHSRKIRIRADEKQLRQVIRQLLNNSLEALAGISKKRIEISTAVIRSDFQMVKHNFMEEKSEYSAVIKIFDNGEGMDASVLERVFDPYFSTRFAGRGLGLAVVQGIMRSHKGAIHISSEMNNGTEVKLYFSYNFETEA